MFKITDDWEEIIKSHKYSRKEFKNGTWFYYYDKDNNFGRITQCKSRPLTFQINKNLPEKDQCTQVEQQASKYINDTWLKDWQNTTPKDKSICMELRNKRVVFEDISYKHLKKQGGNSIGGVQQRTLSNMVRHLRYLPCAKEMLESSGVWTHARYEKLKKPYAEVKNGKKTGKIIVANVYQSVTGYAPKNDKVNNYVQATVSKVKYSDGTYGNTVYISVMGMKNIKKSTDLIPCIFKEKGELKEVHSFGWVATKSIPFNSNISDINSLVNRNIEINISDITEGNRFKKYEQLEKCLNGIEPEYVPLDSTEKLGNVNIKIKDYSNERIEKALRTMAMSLSVPLKAAKGEIFYYKAQEDLTDKWCAYFSKFVRNVYDFVTDYLNLPKKTVMSKSENLVYKGKILYSPETGEPIKKSDWEKFVKNLEKFLNRNKTASEKIVLESKSLAKILDRMLKYNTLEAIKELKLKDVSYHGKSFDWISESVKNMKNALGESFTRQEQARIEVIQQSAAQKVTAIDDKIRNEIKQILVDGVAGRKSKSQVSQMLFDKMVGDNRDFQRLADTEIQNSFNNAFVQEEVYNAKEGEKVYFQRMEVIDKNTCPKCKRLNGKIALWSEKPLNSEDSRDEIADYVIWGGKDGKEWECPIATVHPFCRGVWTRYDTGINNAKIDALVAENSKKAKKWNNAVKQAKKEFEEKGIKNPDDSTKGYTERINELYNAEK